MWRIYYDVATGQIVSIGSVWPETAPPGVEFLELPGPPNFDSQVWDMVTRQLIARPAKVIVDRLQDMLSDPAYSDWQTVWGALNATRRNQVTAALARLLGNQRYRSAGERIEL